MFNLWRTNPHQLTPDNQTRSGLTSGRPAMLTNGMPGRRMTGREHIDALPTTQYSMAAHLSTRSLVVRGMRVLFAQARKSRKGGLTTTDSM